MGRRSKEPVDHLSLVRLIEATGVSERVAHAFHTVDRRFFVPEGTQNPYVDRPIGILERQTTSQPSLIARMVDAADVIPGDKVLEVGTGFGYQTAILAHLTQTVVSIERFDPLSDAARTNLERAGVRQVELVVGDGWKGVPDRGPYDAIIVSAAAPEVPQALGDQLVEGGRLVIPVTEAKSDDVWLYVRKGGRVVRAELLTPARFVPLVRGDTDQSNE